MNKKEKALEAMRSAGLRARANAQANKKSLIRKGVSAGSAYLFGMGTKVGTDGKRPIDMIPDIMGMPRSATVAIAAHGLSMVMPAGMANEAISGVADSMTAVALFQFGSRTDPNARINGVREVSGKQALSEARQLEADLRRMDDTGRKSARREMAEAA